MIVRVVLLLLLFFLGYTVVTAVLRMLGGGTSSPSKPADPDQMVPCSQCGTYVPETEVIRKKIAGQQQQFCSRDCLDTFKRQS